jgi:hypothetical protein
MILLPVCHPHPRPRAGHGGTGLQKLWERGASQKWLGRTNIAHAHMILFPAPSLSPLLRDHHSVMSHGWEKGAGG